MTARALIAGRVMDEYGDPVAGVSVQTEPVPPDRPHVNLFGSSNAATDDRGEFRLITAPGKYYLKANQEGRRVEIRTDGTSGAPFTTTYYPSAANAGASSVVQVGAGQDVAGIEIQLSELLGQPVDLIEEGTLKPRVRRTVEAEAVRAF